MLYDQFNTWISVRPSTMYDVCLQDFRSRVIVACALHGRHGYMGWRRTDGSGYVISVFLQSTSRVSEHMFLERS